MACNMYAQSKWSLKIGANFSQFRNEKMKLRRGFNLGISREWPINKRPAIKSQVKNVDNVKEQYKISSGFFIQLMVFGINKDESFVIS